LQAGIDDRETQRNKLPNLADILDSLVEQDFTAAELEELKKATARLLDGCFDLLSPVGFPFGYRVTKEILVYLQLWIAARLAIGDDKADVLQSWPEALDKAVVQKVLPKIHGNRRVLGDSLKAIAAFLDGLHAASNPPASYTIGFGTPVGIPENRKLAMPGAGPHFPVSRRKLNAMHERLCATGHVSFVS
jgi:hypothetical protein